MMTSENAVFEKKLNNFFISWKRNNLIFKYLNFLISLTLKFAVSSKFLNIS